MLPMMMAEMSLKMLPLAEDGRPVGGLVGPDPLEHTGAVMQAVREYVDLRVLPVDELAVHPDEVRLLHVFAP